MKKRHSKRGGKAARRANERARIYDLFQTVNGSIDEARERAVSEARYCAVCGMLVHPSNMPRHTRDRHPWSATPQMVDALIFGKVQFSTLVEIYIAKDAA